MLFGAENILFSLPFHTIFRYGTYNLTAKNIQCPRKTSTSCPEKHGFHPSFTAISARTKKEE